MLTPSGGGAQRLGAVMSTVSIRIPMPLRGYTDGADEVQVEACDVQEALAALGAAHEGLLARVLAPEGALRPFVNVFVDSRNIRSLDGLATSLADGDIIAIIPAVAGGCPQRTGPSRARMPPRGRTARSA